VERQRPELFLVPINYDITEPNERPLLFVPEPFRPETITIRQQLSSHDLLLGYQCSPFVFEVTSLLAIVVDYNFLSIHSMELLDYTAVPPQI
jgi:hypothetical protein